MNLLDLPDCMIEQIFDFFSYDEIARKRLINTRLDKICQKILNRGFSKVIKRHATDLKRIKSMLPRRESERKNHPLSRHSEVLTSIETRISMLSMTYTKYIELNLCCFIPGKVLDEVLIILRLIETTNKPIPRPQEVLQELRDISSMAIEHFDEKIALMLKKSFLDFNTQKYIAPASLNTVMPPTNDEILSLPSEIPVDTVNQPPENCYRFHARMRLSMLSMERKYKEAVKKLNHFTQIQSKQLRQMRTSAIQMSDINSQIVDLRRRLEESDAKNREISANISQIALDSGSGVGDDGSNNNSTNKSRNIKPRTATIILKRRITEPIMGSNIDIATKKTKKNSE